MGLKSEILANTGNSSHDHNGVQWYFAPSHSWGYAPVGAGLSRAPCDVAAGSDRVCWHTSATGLGQGHSCGSNRLIGQGTTSTHERVIYHRGGTIQ